MVAIDDTTTNWFKARVKRHLSELWRLALPTSLSRLGVMALGIVDVAVVGHYATKHLAWLNLANQSIIMIALVIGIGLMLGIMVMVADAYGREDFEQCGRVWRRSMPFAMIISLILLILCWPANHYLTWLGQSPENIEETTKLIRIIALGLPAHVIFFGSNLFLEGIKRPAVALLVMILANIVNLFFDIALVFGMFGFPEMGAEGSAWASTVVRWFMMLVIVGYIWFAPSLKKYGVRKPHGERWSSWRKQREIGYAAAVSLAMEVCAFTSLVIFAGWLGTVALAAYGIVFQLIAVPFMLAMGIGMASSVRVGISHSRNDRLDTQLAGWVGVGMNMILLTLLSLAIYFFAEGAMALFTDDPAVIAALIPLVWVIIFLLIFDASQGVISNILRGLQETWFPTTIQTIAYLGIMIPLAYYLAIPSGHGIGGLLLGAAFASIFSSVLLAVRFWWVTRSTSKLFD